MARVNSGLDPKHLSDQHLIAESVEITMITGSLRVNGYKIKGIIPKTYTLGKGHMNFFKDKLVYLQKRLNEVNKEIKRRGYKSGTHIDLTEFPKELHNDWTPTKVATTELRLRVADRLLNPKSGRKGAEFHRYEGQVLGEQIKAFHRDILESSLFFV